jgi:hypothetical protein
MVTCFYRRVVKRRGFETVGANGTWGWASCSRPCVPRLSSRAAGSLRFLCSAPFRLVLRLLLVVVHLLLLVEQPLIVVVHLLLTILLMLVGGTAAAAANLGWWHGCCRR